MSILNKLKPCECGCGELIHIKDKGYRPRRFKRGHNSKGQNHPMWKDGIVSISGGYILQWNPDHPYSQKHGYVYKHRLIVEEIYSKIFGVPIYIDPNIWDIHHKDGNPRNNDPSNLELILHNHHGMISGKEAKGKPKKKGKQKL